MDGTTNLTEAERLLLLTVREPFVFMPDGLLEPLSANRMRELWWAARARAVAQEPEPV